MGNGLKTAPSYRFGQVAAAIGVKEQTLRNWLHRNKEIDLFEERPRGGWRTFSESDVLVLSVAAELNRVGCPIGEAAELARNALGDVNFKTMKGLPDFLWAARTADGWRVETEKGLLGGRLRSIVRVAVPICFAEAMGRLPTQMERR